MLIGSKDQIKEAKTSKIDKKEDKKGAKDQAEPKNSKPEEKKPEKEKPIKLEGKCSVLEHSGLFSAYESKYKFKLKKLLKLK